MTQMNHIETKTNKKTRTVGIVFTAILYAVVLLIILRPDLVDRALL